MYKKWLYFYSNPNVKSKLIYSKSIFLNILQVGQDDRPICRCKETYVGNPLSGCKHECDTDGECGQTQSCDRRTYRYYYLL